MKPEDAQRDRQAVEIFSRAVEMAGAEVRAAYLEGACGGDERLKARVEALLAHHVQDSFLQQPAASLGPDATVVQPVTEKAGDRIGRYRLLQQIGEGGCGVVYMAEQEEPVRRRVALKVIKLGMDTKSVIARFEAERQALALMDHPNIARVFDAGATETGRPYFVMELVRGIKITDYCDQNNLSTSQRLDLFIQVCHAIQHAHHKGIIHRDIKPSNILVSMHDGVPVPVVIDFGIAKATEQRLTEKTLFTAFEQFIGTPAYTSPEQAEMSRLDIDTRSDIYSLGVLLYELLTGKTPFDSKELLAAGLEEMRRTIREQEPARPSTRLNTLQSEELTTTAKRRGTELPKLIHLVRGDLDWIVMKCLEKDRTRRYETANGLAQDLERHLKQEPVVARPPSRAYRAQKFVRRNKVMVTAAGLVAAALVLGIVVSTWQAVRASRLRVQAEANEQKAVAAQMKESAERQKAQQAEASEAEQRRLAVQAGDAEKQARLQADRLLYVANMNVAQAAWEQSNIGRLRQMLEDTQESPYRGFEWYYWQQKTHLAVKTFRGHLDSVFSAAFSPDGQRIVTGSWDQTATVWDAASGRELFTLKGHHGRIHSVAFSPDGKRIVTGSWDQTAKVWDAATGRELLKLAGHANSVLSVAFSPNSQRIVTGSRDKTAKVWEAASGNLLLTLEGHGEAVVPVGFSLDGQRIVTSGGDRTARVWDVTSGKQLLKLEGHSGDVLAAFSPDGRRIVTGSRDQTAKVWDAASGKELLTLKGRNGPINCVAYSSDGFRIVAAIDDNTAKVWDAADGRELFTLKGHSGPVMSAAFSPDGRRIVTSSLDQTAKVWEAANGLFDYNTGGSLLMFKGHTNGISSVAFSPDSQRVVTGSWDDTAKVWEAAGGHLERTLQGHTYGARSVAFSPDGQRIVTGSGDKTAKVWEAATGSPLLTLEGLTGGVNAVAFSPDGQRIVAGSDDILPGSDDCIAAVWDAVSGKQLLTLNGHSDGISSVAFSPDGQRIVTGSYDRITRVWEAANGRELLTLKARSDWITCVALSRDGQRIVTGSDDQTAKVWVAASGKEALTLTGHSGGIRSVAFSPDGRRIVTGSDDQTAKLWAVTVGKELLTLQGHRSVVGAVAFFPSGERIVTGGSDQTVKVWAAATAEQVASWQQEEKAATERLATLRRDQAVAAQRERELHGRVPGAITQWLVLAPFPFARRAGMAELDQEWIPQEARLRPRAGERVKVGESELVWNGVQLKDYLLDFNQLLGEQIPRSVGYAVCYIESEADQGGLLMKVGSDDEAKIYLNGEEIYRYAGLRPWVPDQDAVAGVKLKAGRNVLLFKVANEAGPWQGSIRLTDAAGQPVKGIRVTLTPP